MTEQRPAQSGQCAFRGQVQDHDGRPLEGLVRVFRGDSPVVSRKVTGSFMLQLPPGPYRIEAHVDGYQPVQFKIDLHASQGAAHLFVLNPIWRPGQDAPSPASPLAPDKPVTSSCTTGDPLHGLSLEAAVNEELDGSGNSGES